ncbi:MAG: hypothetical protein IT365_26010, partial [Candidatus Hydrogenedentes bacterium]|nr:hypothetical protein [Candidatus Hydrogenedentota bacterium]
MNLAKNVKVTRVSNAEAAAQTAINSTGVDMTGFDGVMFLVPFGAITSGGVQSVNAAQGSDNSADWVDLEGSKIAVADDDDNQIVVLDIYKPKDRYV